MKKIILLIVGVLFLNNSFGQHIEMKLNFLGYEFVQNGKNLSWKELVLATESNAKGNLLLKKAKSQNIIFNVLTLGGGGLIGVPIGQSISNQDPNWSLAIIGGGLVAIAIPFTFSIFNKTKEGIDLYNLSIARTSRFQFRPAFKVITNQNGIGLSIHF